MKKILVVAVVLFAGCDNQHLVGRIGQNGNDAGPSSTADARQAVPVESLDARVIGPITQAQTSWTGYIENYQFPSGSDVVTFTFAADSAGEVVGSVVLGNGTPPAPATDPNVGYPSNLPSTGYDGSWTEGFSYSMVNGLSTPTRLRFTIRSFELWSGWCALQTPVQGSDMCLPNWGGAMTNGQCSQTNPANGTTTIVDCGKLNLCLEVQVCVCSTVPCVVTPNAGPELSFDIAITNNDASGSVSGHNVHFTQDQ